MAYRWLRFRPEPRDEENEQQPLYTNQPIAMNVDENVERIQQIMGNSDDLNIRRLDGLSIRCAVIFLNCLTKSQAVDEFVIAPLIKHLKLGEASIAPQSVSEYIETSSINEHTQLNDMVKAILNGKVVLFVDGITTAYSMGIPTEERRNVEEPASQVTIRGPREGFVEQLDANVGLIRYKIRHPDLRFKYLTLGEKTQTKICLAYMEGVVQKDVLENLHNRLEHVKAEKIFDTGMLEELIEDRRYTPFPTLLPDERPDVAAAAICEGRVIILVDGTPFVSIVPAPFIAFFHAAEDYYQRYDLATFIRLIRFISFFLALSFPSLYIAVTTFHPELIPTELLITLMGQREALPFPVFLEAFIMEVAFEILREAGVRMPRPIGTAVSIVGAIVIGEAAVRAGLVSPAVVIVVALTAIASFVIPYYGMSGAVRVLRFLLIILGATMGLFGIVIFFIALVIHLCSLQTMGKPYMAPFAPFQIRWHKDTILRLPLWWHNYDKSTQR